MPPPGAGAVGPQIQSRFVKNAYRRRTRVFGSEPESGRYKSFHAVGPDHTLPARRSGGARIFPRRLGRFVENDGRHMVACVPPPVAGPEKTPFEIELSPDFGSVPENQGCACKRKPREQQDRERK